MSATEVKIPTLGESISEGVIARWLKKDGDAAKMDEALVELETDKASVEIPAPKAGVLRILKQVGDTVKVGEVVARLEEGTGTQANAQAAVAAATPPAAKGNGAAKPAEALAAAHQATVEAATAQVGADAGTASKTGVLAPTVRKLALEHDLDPKSIPGTGPKGRVTQEDVMSHLKSSSGAPAPQTKEAATPAPAKADPATAEAPAPARAPSSNAGKRVPMTRLRQRIAERLVHAQHTAAILTTFNEVDMTAVMEWRAKHKERFQKAHGIALGFLSFFSKACVAALKDMPIVGAQVDGTDIVYPERINLGVAVATDRGLVVPVVHEAEHLDIAGLEREIARLANLAREGKLGIPDLSGGTFSISNGGVFGSLLSTPILNPPQSAILGMHKIEKRPVVVSGPKGDEIAIRPMMYVALSYDHRIIDGSDAVTFLVKVKERLEDPSRLLLDI